MVPAPTIEQVTAMVTGVLVAGTTAVSQTSLVKVAEPDQDPS